MPAVRRAETVADWTTTAQMFREYVDGLPFVIDFQDVERELADVRAIYDRPDGGAYLVSVDGTDVGAVGLVRFDDHDVEMKRMYVRTGARGTGAGRALAEHVIEVARAHRYERMLLDTVKPLVAAIALYESLGFRRIERYRHNPRPDARFYALDLADRAP